MRNLQLYIATSLDMYVASPDGGIDWLFTDGDYGYETFLGGIDTVLLGYKTYAQVLGFGPYPYADKTSYIFTRQQRPKDPYVTFIQEDPAQFVRTLKSQSGSKIWLVGGGQINQLCYQADLIDELILSIHPIWLGEGIPLFEPGSPQRKWKLVQSVPYPSGLVQLQYSRLT